MTVYNILKQLTDTPPGSWVVVQGAGGGLGHMGTCVCSMYPSRTHTLTQEFSTQKPLGTVS